ncbi:MAG: hypothetical protein ABS39_07245 [Acidovorax sp. SCN 65-28]|uniref:hypothetical protein n=1 Tax=Acidovorax sp. TaxID=1872122 RepID=UPI00086BCF2A|nr:hypothetical protein [Acidovorax sp.]MBN9625553.1 hypothetical protein [Acidovorax sp.]ODS78181.1 MAG: hypothetical protein ABS39_07245 [Acidovorax sp. SCN 65-28]
MSAEHVYRVASSGWLHCHGHQVEEVPAWPRLTHSALVVLDMDDVYTDVWRFEGKTEYAAALVEKRVRTQGLVEGAAHVVVHRLVKLPGGFQVFFSAISLDLWQRCTQWAKEQDDHCLVMMAGGLLCDGVASGGARIVLTQRRLMCFVQSEEGMVFGSTQALGSGPSAMASAAQVLTSNHSALLTRLGAEAVEWGTLWSTQPADVDTCLAAVRSVAGGAPVVMHAQEMTLASERVHTVMPALARKAAGRHALNPGLERVAWRAERWVAPITVVTALVGIVLAIVGMLVGQLADQQRNAGMNQRAELETLQSRIQAVSSVEAPQKLLPVAEFSRTLDEGARHDPVAFMAVLKAASNKDIRIQRVRLETTNSLGGAQPSKKAFRVDGVVAPGASASVTRWVSQMAAAGWTLRAVDPTFTLPGSFSYELVANAAAPGNVKP